MQIRVRARVSDPHALRNGTGAVVTPTPHGSRAPLNPVRPSRAQSGPVGHSEAMEIWLNPACSKCRTAASALDEAGITYTVRRYLDTPPSVDELDAVVTRLGLEPWDIARPEEVRKAGIDLPKDPEHRQDWLAAMAANPRSIQRPLLTADDGTTVVGRDEESLARVIAAQQSSA